jgi:hypothetical protein
VTEVADTRIRVPGGVHASGVTAGAGDDDWVCHVGSTSQVGKRSTCRFQISGQVRQGDKTGCVSGVL